MTSYSWLTLSVAVQIYNIVGRVVACRLVMRQRVARENLGCSHARGGWKICGSVTHRSNLLANEVDLQIVVSECDYELIERIVRAEEGRVCM